MLYRLHSSPDTGRERTSEVEAEEKMKIRDMDDIEDTMNEKLKLFL